MTAPFPGLEQELHIKGGGVKLVLSYVSLIYNEYTSGS